VTVPTGTPPVGVHLPDVVTEAAVIPLTPFSAKHCDGRKGMFGIVQFDSRRPVGCPQPASPGGSQPQLLHDRPSARVRGSVYSTNGPLMYPDPDGHCVATPACPIQKLSDAGAAGRQNAPALHDPWSGVLVGMHSSDRRDQAAGGRVSAVLGEHAPPVGTAGAISSVLHPLGAITQVDVSSGAGAPHGIAQFGSEKNDTAGIGHVTPVGAEHEHTQTAEGTFRPAAPWNAIEYESPHVGAPASAATSANATGPLHPDGAARAQN